MGDLKLFTGVRGDLWRLENALKNSFWTKKEPARLALREPPFDAARILSDDAAKKAFGLARVIGVNVEGEVEEDLAIAGRCFSVNPPPAATIGRRYCIQEELDAIVRFHGCSALT